MSSSSSSSSLYSILPPFLCDEELGKLLRKWHVKPATPTSASSSTSTSRTTPIPNDLYQRLEKLVDVIPMLKKRDTDKEESGAYVRGVMERLIKRVMENDPNNNNSAKYQQLIHKINPPPLPQQQHEVDIDIGLSDAEYEARYADKLDDKERACLRVFSMLPEGFVVNKTEVFYLSLGLSIHDYHREKYPEDDSTLEKLVAEGFLTRTNTSTSNCFSNSYTMQSSVLSWARQKNDIQWDAQAVERGFQVLQDTNSFVLVRDINSKFLKGIQVSKVAHERIRPSQSAVLHLGTWRGKRQSADQSNNYSPGDYILFDQESLFKAFFNIDRRIRWLSLRGISGIVHLPASIFELTYLHFLDLSACNSLEYLPNAIRFLKSLEYLDLSQCYKLEYIPKDITSLPSLKVLKGFIINSDPHVLPTSSRRKWCNKRTAPTSSSSFCPFSELSHLQDLEKLTIRTTRMIFPTNEDLHTLCSLQRLRILGITWAGNPKKAQIDDNLQQFPDTLEKLELQTAPPQTKSQLLELIGKQKQRSRLNKLYIRGGWLRAFSPQKHCFPTVKIVRLRYLPNLEGNWDQFRVSFPNLTCLEIFQCPKLTSFPCDSNGIWQK